MQTVGVLGQLADALGTVGGTQEALIFGSWAARYEGEPGPPPRDIALLVVGDADLREVRRACHPVEDALRVEINPIILTTAEWRATTPDPFVAQLKSQPPSTRVHDLDSARPPRRVQMDVPEETGLSLW